MKKKYWIALLTVGGMVLVALCARFAGLSAGTGEEMKTGALHGPAALDRLKNDGQYESLKEAVNQARLSVSWTAVSPLGGAAWRAPNPDAGYNAYVTEAGVSIAINDESKSSVSLSLQSIGYGADLQSVGSGEVSGTGETIQVRRSGSLQEWYVNGPDGLEQGFTLSEPPARHVVPPEGGTTYPLRLALKVSDGWHAVASDDGKQVELRGPDGETVQYGKLFVRDNPGRDIPARLTVVNAQVVIEVEDSHAEYPLTIDPLFTLQRRLTAREAKTQDYFGHSVALDGNTALVGAPYDDVDHQDQGSAYVFVRNGTTWTEQAQLTAADGANLDLFGWVVALDGNTALVGAYNGPGLASADQGAVYVFVRQGTSWSQQARLNASDGVAAGGFGRVLALDSNTAIAGAPNYRVNQILAPGAAYVFVRNGSTWTEQARLTANDGEDNDQFGAAVGVEDNTAIIGAPADDVGTTSNQGSAYLFTRNGVLWGARQKLTGTNPAANDFFGNAIAIDGETALIGAYLKFIDDLGIVYVFERRAAGWIETTTIGSSYRGTGAHLGISVALSGDRAVIGASLGLFEPGPDQRTAYVFSRLGNRDFFQVRDLGPDLGSADDRFGYAVAIDDDTVLVGAHRGDVTATDQGAAYAFVQHDSRHVEQQKLIAHDGDRYEYFGDSVALSGDTLVVGSDGDDIGDNANQGSVYVFTRNGTAWSLQQKILAEDGAAGDSFGCAVAIDGDTLVAGARYADIGGNQDQGAAYVFTRNGTVWTLQKKLKAIAIDGLANDNFGGAVALDRDTVVVGATGVNNQRGAAYVFTRNGTVWTEQAKLTANNGADRDEFGLAVALSGDTLVAGAPFAKIGENETQGAAYVFIRTGAVWTQRTRLTAIDGEADDRFGCAVDVTHQAVVVGAVFDTIGMNSRQGSVYVFVRSGTAFVPGPKLIARDGAADDRFGSSVALSFDILAVGAVYDTSSTNSAQGSVYTFTDLGGHWYPQQKLTASEGGTQDYFGRSVAVSDEFVAVGASGDDIGENDSQGSAYVFASPACPTLSLAPETLHDGVVGVAYQQSISTSPAPDPYDYEYSVTDGALPPGMTLDDYTVRGTPTTPGTYRFTIASTFFLSACTGSRDYIITITATCPVITITPGTLPTATMAVAYSQALIVSGAAAPYTFTLDVGSSMPPGLSFVNGVIAGTPTQAGTFNLMMRLKDVNGCTGAQNYSLTINPACNIMPVTLPPAIQDKPYNTTLTATGGTGAYSFELASGALPPGLSLSPGGVLSGTSTEPGNFRFTVFAKSSGCIGTRAYTLGVGCVTFKVSPDTLPVARLGVAYSETMTATGGAAPYKYRIDGPSPPGLGLSPEGVLIGTPTQAGRFALVVYVQDNGVCLAVKGFTLVVSDGCDYTIAPTNQSLPAIASAGEMTVKAGESCAWIVTGNPPWLTITGGANGTGTGKVMYSVAANTGAAREAMLTVAGQTHFVRQAAGATESPRIDRLTPNSARMGTDGVILDVIGSGFTESHVVQWNGIQIETTNDGDTFLRAVVPAALLASEGNVTVMVVDTVNGAQSNTGKFRVVGTVAHASAASYDTISLAPDSIVAAFGANLATEVRSANSLPLPTELAGTTVTVRDSQGTPRLAPLLFVSPSQVNYVMPPGVADGVATVIVTNGDGLVVESLTEISTVAPGLFSAKSTGEGAAAALVFLLADTGEQVYEPIARYDAETQTFVLLPIDLEDVFRQVYLILYGTGIRHRTLLEDVTVRIGETELPVSYAGPAPPYEGLDQVNVLLPRGLRGRGEQTVVLQVKDRATNAVKVYFR